MHVGNSTRHIDLDPRDARRGPLRRHDRRRHEVFFTTADHLTGDDTDASADIFRADVGSASATADPGLERAPVAPGTPTPATPTADLERPGTPGAPSCGDVAIAGGGGVAAGRAAPSTSSAPRSSTGLNGDRRTSRTSTSPDPGRQPALRRHDRADEPGRRSARRRQSAPRRPGDFQVTPQRRRRGVHLERCADRRRERRAFRGLPLRPGRAEARLRLVPADRRPRRTTTRSCRTRLGLTDDGRVFFTPPSRSPRSDTNGAERRLRVEASGGPAADLDRHQPLDSRLLSVSATVPTSSSSPATRSSPEDQNGPGRRSTTPARRRLLVQLQAPPCKASDECHGPGTAAVRAARHRHLPGGRRPGRSRHRREAPLPRQRVKAPRHLRQGKRTSAGKEALATRPAAWLVTTMAVETMTNSIRRPSRGHGPRRCRRRRGVRPTPASRSRVRSRHHDSRRSAGTPTSRPTSPSQTRARPETAKNIDRQPPGGGLRQSQRDPAVHARSTSRSTSARRLPGRR